MPAEVRQAMQLDETGSKLRLLYNPKTKNVKIEKPITFEDIRNITRKYLKSGMKPLLDPRRFYESREPKR